MALLLLLALPASATVVVRQVDVLDIVSGPTTNPLGMAQSDPFRYRVTSVQGTSVLSYAGSTAVTGLLTDVRLGDVVGRATGTINNAAGGEFTFYLTPSALLDVGAYYEFRGYVYGATGVIGTVAWDPVTMGGAVCSTCSAAAASVTVNPTSTVMVVYTNLTIINVTNQMDNITSTIENYYTSGVSSVNGQTGPVQIVVTSGGSLSTNGTTLEIAVSGAAQSPLTNSLDGSGNVISNAAARLNSLRVGANVSDAGSNNVALTGWSTFGAGAKGNVSAGNGITFNNAVLHSIASGTNIVVAGSYSGGVGRDLNLGANYDFVVGLGNTLLSGAQMSSIGGGYINTNEGASYATIGGGTRNAQGSGALFSYIPGGASNRVDAIGGGAIGHSGYVPSTATNALILSVGTTRQTNPVPHSILFNAPAGVRLIGGGSLWVDGQQGISSTTLLLRADGVSIYTQIVVRGVHIQ